LGVCVGAAALLADGACPSPSLVARRAERREAIAIQQ